MEAYTMKIFEEIMNEVREEMKEASFPDLIRAARDRTGLKQYRAAEFIGISLSRLRNLEGGFFRDMPRSSEIERLSTMFDLPYEDLEGRAKQFVEKTRQSRKVRIIKDGPGGMPIMQACERQ
jgi:transcriptional regulator with XRE-family HTH domain